MFDNIISAIEAGAKAKKEGGAAATKNRISVMQSLVNILKNPPTSMEDSPAEIAYNEEELLGISITCSKIDSCDTSEVNTTCKDFMDGKEGFMILGVEITEVREFKTKKGKNPGSKMAGMTICDSSCSIPNVVAFPDIWKDFAELLFKGNTVLLQGERGKDDGLVIKKVWQAR